MHCVRSQQQCGMPAAQRNHAVASPVPWPSFYSKGYTTVPYYSGTPYRYPLLLAS